MLTVVMLNWRRPHNVLQNLRHYAAFNIVHRVICFNNGPRLRYHGRLPDNVVVIEASQDLGLYSRLATGALATTSAVFHTDDDLLVPESSLMALYDRWCEEPNSCHGLHGRNAVTEYDPKNQFGRVDIVLTRALICSRAVNDVALAATPYFADLGSVPVGNGEDIILSFAASFLSGVRNAAYDLSYVEQPDRNDDAAGVAVVAIHKRWPGHLQHRTNVVVRCRNVFGGASAQRR